MSLLWLGVTLHASNITPVNLNWFEHLQDAAGYGAYGGPHALRISKVARDERPAAALCSLLPEGLSSFVAKMEEDGTALLLWTMLQESGREVYTPERSADGIHWETITSIASPGGSQQPRHYEIRDNYPPAALAYYRLGITGIETVMAHSDVILLRRSPDEENGKLMISPNPACSYVKISSTGPPRGLRVTLLNDAGCKMLERNQPGGRALQLSTSHLANGIYYLDIYTGKCTYRKKLLIAR